MTLILSLITPSMALDCSPPDLDDDICAAANSTAELINDESNDTVVFDGASKARLRPLALYDIFESMLASAAANGCSVGAVTIEDGMGGVWSAGSDTWSGITESDNGAVGTFDRRDKTWEGSLEGTPFATEFGVFNNRMQAVGDLDGDQFVAGTWIRTSGRNGVHATLFGSCDNSIAEAFGGWFVGGLDEFLPPVSEDPPFLGDNVANGTCTSDLTGEVLVENESFDATETSPGTYTAVLDIEAGGAAISATVDATASAVPGEYDLAVSDSGGGSGSGTAVPDAGDDYDFEFSGQTTVTFDLGGGQVLTVPTNYSCDLIVTPVSIIQPL